MSARLSTVRQSLAREPVAPPAGPPHVLPTARNLAHLLASRFNCRELVCATPGDASLPHIARPASDRYFYWEDDGGLLDRGSASVDLLRALARDSTGGVVALSAPAHRETALTSLRILERRLASAGLEIAFSGFTAADGCSGKPIATLAVDGVAAGLHGTTPASFRVVALMQVYNEADVLEAALSSLTRQGVEVWVLDNWSTDGSFEIASAHLGRGVLRVGRFPADGPQTRFSFRDVLLHKEVLAWELDADWLLLSDADEIRTSPWPGVSLRDALFRVESAGFNAVDYTTIVFPPVDDGFEPGTDPEAYFRRFEFGNHPSDFARVGTWKNASGPVRIASSAGHDVAFEGRRVFPYKFLLKHYAIRSQTHGERKVFRERFTRWDPAERAIGWHTHYDHLNPGDRLLRPPQTLFRFDPEDFRRRFLAERLTGLGACYALTRKLTTSPSWTT